MVSTQTLDGVGETTTYRLGLFLDTAAANVYTVFGRPQAEPLTMPPAFQAPAPFGADFGGTNPGFWAVMAGVEQDSWVTASESDGNTGNQLAAIGIDFSMWTLDSGLNVQDGAVFWMNPDAAPAPENRHTGGTAVVAQLTLAAGVPMAAVVNAQGQSVDSDNNADWAQFGIVFGEPGAAVAPAPAPSVETELGFRCTCGYGMVGDCVTCILGDGGSQPPPPVRPPPVRPPPPPSAPDRPVAPTATYYVNSLSVYPGYAGELTPGGTVTVRQGAAA
eukprot:SAG22_NODE_1760_length_3634_cov_1.814144_4_plen_275_part_00